MVQLVTLAVIALAIVMAAGQNPQVVPIYFFGAYEAPLIVVVGVSFFSGFAVAVIGVLLRTLRGSHRNPGKRLPPPPVRRGTAGRRLVTRDGP